MRVAVVHLSYVLCKCSLSSSDDDEKLVRHPSASRADELESSELCIYVFLLDKNV